MLPLQIVLVPKIGAFETRAATPILETFERSSELFPRLLHME